MAEIGLFTREDYKRAVPTAPRGLPLERMRAMGPAAVRGMNPGALCPEMPPSGDDRPLVYVLGEAPGATEDKAGYPFCGKSGEYLRAAFPRSYAEFTRFNNCCRTRPPENRTPTAEEVEAFRDSVALDIKTSKPRAILGTGYVPLRWFLGSTAPPISAARGRRFPVDVAGHACWYYPVLHPAYILRIRNAGRIEDIPGEEWERVWHVDVRRCFDEAAEAEAGNRPGPDILPPAWLARNVTLLTGRPGDAATLRAWLARATAAAAPAGVDFETSRLRPYERGAKLLTAAISAATGTIAFPIKHPGAAGPTEELAGLLGEFLCGPLPRIAHNAPFECEWAYTLYGPGAFRGGRWYCTEAAAYILDEREGQGLDFCCRLELGLPLKSQSTLDRARLEYAPLGDVLRYNAGDAKVLRPLLARQYGQLTARGQAGVYAEQIDRIPAVAMAQHAGLVRDPAAVSELQSELGRKHALYIRQIQQTPAVRRYIARYGKFDPGLNGSSRQVTHIFQDFLQRREGLLASGKYSVKEECLGDMADEPLAGLILKLRGVHKLKSTYIDPLDPAAENSVVYPDGKIHPQIKPTYTRSGRLSIEDPSAQNWPIRKAGQIRRAISCAADEVLLAADYGQLEARGIAIHSDDQTLVDALWTGYDIHKAWAERINEIHPQSCREYFGDPAAPKVFDQWRNMVKASLVFAAFYLASELSIQGYFNWPGPVARQIFGEFWAMFRGVKEWQRREVGLYYERGYAEALNGRRRTGPLSENMIANSPIQGFSSDIVCKAWVRLQRLALVTDRPWLAPVLNIHDDLTARVPRRHADEAVEIYARELTRKPYPYVQVPIAVDIKIGRNWGAMEKVLKYEAPAARPA